MFCIAAGLAVAAPVVAAPSVDWVIDASIARGQTELFWTSPTTIDLGFDRYDFSYEITKIEATVRLLFDVTQDVTDLVGESFPLVDSGRVDTLPLVLADEALDDPTTGTQANVFIAVDENGFGQAAFTDVALGRVDIGLGELDIRAIRIVADVGLVGVDLPPGDLDGDGAVTPNDYAVWVSRFGAAGAEGDGNGDRLVGAADYTVWRDASASATAVPEPLGATMIAIALISLAPRAGRRALLT